jgi:hypothetical protein
MQGGQDHSEDHNGGADHRRDDHEPPDQRFHTVAVDRLFRTEPEKMPADLTCETPVIPELALLSGWAAILDGAPEIPTPLIPVDRGLDQRPQAGALTRIAEYQFPGTLHGPRHLDHEHTPIGRRRVVDEHVAVLAPHHPAQAGQAAPEGKGSAGELGAGIDALSGFQGTDRPPV